MVSTAGCWTSPLTKLRRAFHLQTHSIVTIQSSALTVNAAQRAVSSEALDPRCGSEYGQQQGLPFPSAVQGAVGSEVRRLRPSRPQSGAQTEKRCIAAALLSLSLPPESCLCSSSDSTITQESLESSQAVIFTLGALGLVPSVPSPAPQTCHFPGRPARQPGHLPANQPPFSRRQFEVATPTCALRNSATCVHGESLTDKKKKEIKPVFITD